MKILRLFLTISVLAVLVVIPAYGKSDKDNADHEGHIEKTHPTHPVHVPDRARGHGAALRRELSISRERQQVTMRQRLPDQNALRRIVRDTGHRSEKRDVRLMKSLNEAISKLEHSRWAYNPHDDRGQGNMGSVDMIAPYGHDKDSDRKELYGNRGRVIRAVEPTPPPEPTPEPTPPPEPVPEPPF